ncbi:hypothetical protein TSUKUMMB_40680 [Rhodococcus sp. no. 34]
MARLNGMNEICARTGLGRTLIYEQIAAGTLRTVKVGRRRLATDEAIDEFIDHLVQKSDAVNSSQKHSDTPTRSPMDERSLAAS